MTAGTISLADYHASAPSRRFWPEEGWTTLVAVAALPAAFAWSLDDAGWLPQSMGSTGYLVYLAVAAAILGIGLAKLGLRRGWIYLIGAVIGGLLVPFIAGGAILASQSIELRPPALGFAPEEILARYEAAADVARRVWIDLAINGQPYTAEFGHYHMVFAAMVWAAGLLAASAAIRRRRPLDAVAVTGVLLLMNEALTKHEQIQILVFFTIAALVLLIRSHVFEEQVAWVRRRIGDPTSVAELYFSSGARFVAVAVLGALALTAVASSAPLQGAWTDLPNRLAEFGRWLERFAPPGGDPRPAGLVGFQSNAVTNGLWAPDPNRVAFVAEVPPDAPSFRWRVGTYSAYTSFGWDWGTTAELPALPGEPVLGGTGDDPTRFIERTDVQIRITPEAFVDPSAVSPDSIYAVDRPATLLGVGSNFRFTTVRLGGGSGPYVVDALVPSIGDTATGITENRLRAAGTTYPIDINRTYLQLPANAIGPAAQAILDTVEAGFGSKAAAEAQPYDLARALEAYLRDPANFHYQTDVRADVRTQCSGLSTVECFARIRRGYCEYYASEMAVLLRQARIPARIAYGFLPATRTASGVESVPASGQHWWVEVYFPNTGWVAFDPTGTVGRPEVLPSGAPVTPRPTGGSFVPRETEPVGRRSLGPANGGGGPTSPTSGTGPFAVTALLLVAAVVIAVVAARRRSLAARPMHPDTAWGGLGRLAGRFGFGPRPSQTVYEYAGALGDLVPTARVEVGTVARAKVEVAYGRRELGEARLRTVGEAYRRLRLAVLRAGITRRLLRRGR